MALAGCHQIPVRSTWHLLLHLTFGICERIRFFQKLTSITFISLSTDITTVNSWIQVNLGEAKKITGVVIQGCPGADHWVTKFKIQHSMDGSKWTDYKDDGGVNHIKHSRLDSQAQFMPSPRLKSSLKPGSICVWEASPQFVGLWSNAPYWDSWIINSRS